MSPDRTYEMEADHSSSALADPAKSTASLSALLHAGLGVPSPFMKDIFLVRQAIVGTRYLGGSDELVDDLKPGSRISFIAEPDNKYDENAVMALDSQGRKLGYIPMHENSIISALLKAGKSIQRRERTLFLFQSVGPADKTAHIHDVPIAELRKELGRAGASSPCAAVDHDGRLKARDQVGRSLRGNLIHREKLRIGCVSGQVFRLLPDVKKDDTGVLEHVMGFGKIQSGNHGFSSVWRRESR